MTTQESKLYVLATPLGNKDDLTLRARTIFETCGIFFAEDTREFKKLLSLHGVSIEGKAVHSYAKHNIKKATEDALAILGTGKDVVLTSDRGTPGICDPGAELVHLARASGVSVIPIPGVCSVTALLSVSGINPPWLFAGFLSHTAKEREALWSQTKKTGIPFCFFESPKRIAETLLELKEHFPEGSVFWGREMTKRFEQYEKLELSALDIKQVNEKGEYTVLLVPGTFQTEKETLVEEAVDLRASSDKEWAKHLAQKTGLAANVFYNALQKKKKP